jgi:hypothetical protein
MSDTPDPKPSVAVEAKPSEWRSPQVILPIVATISTILVAVIGVIPSIIEANKPPAVTPTAMVIAIIATPVPATTVPVEVAAVSTLAPTNAPAATDKPTDVPPSPTVLIPTDRPMTDTPTSAPTEIPATVIPTDIPPTAAPTAVPNVTLFYDQDSFTIYNMTSSRISLEGIVFKGPDVSWNISPFGGSMKSLPSSKCLRLRDATVGNRTPPAECGGTNYAFLEIGPTAIFWRNQYFDVVRDGAVLATCQFDAGKCEIHVAQ